MVFDIKTLQKRAYTPYHKECLYCIGNDIHASGIILILTCVFAYKMDDAAINDRTIFFSVIFILIGFAVSECFLNYRLSIISVFERNKAFEKKKVQICQIVEEASWSGHLWTSAISKLYPQSIDAGRYKLICQNDSGERIILRSVMSEKKRRIIAARIFDAKSTKCVVYYGCYSKIVMYYESNEKWTDIINHTF